jgi:hypothetical protein
LNRITAYQSAVGALWEQSAALEVQVEVIVVAVMG